VLRRYRRWVTGGFWFYVVPHKELPKIQASAPVGKLSGAIINFLCHRGKREEPSQMPVPRVHLGHKSGMNWSSSMPRVAIEDTQQNGLFNPLHDLFQDGLNQLEIARFARVAAAQVYSNEQAFALQVGRREACRHWKII